MLLERIYCIHINEIRYPIVTLEIGRISSQRKAQSEAHKIHTPLITCRSNTFIVNEWFQQTPIEVDLEPLIF